MGASDQHGAQPGETDVIPLFSLDGAAVGTSISEVPVTVLLVAFATQVSGRVDWMRVAAGPTLAGAVAAVALLVLDRPAGAVIAIAGLTYLATLTTFAYLVFPGDARLMRGFLLRRLAA